MQTMIIEDLIKTQGYKVDCVDVQKRIRPKRPIAPDCEDDEEGKYDPYARANYYRRARYATLCVVLTNGTENLTFDETYVEKDKNQFAIDLATIGEIIRSNNCLT